MDLHDADLYTSHMEEQLPYHAIQNEYGDSIILKEALLFMDEAFPEWKTNGGAGTWAAEFMHECLEELAYLQDDETELSSFEILKEIYLNLAYNYPIIKNSYHRADYASVVKGFEIANPDFDYETEHLSPEDYLELYKIKLAEFEKEHIKIVIFNFDF